MSNKPAKPAPHLPFKRPAVAGISDHQTLRDRARKDIEDGAITDSYSADRKVVIKLLNDALATELCACCATTATTSWPRALLADAVKGEFLEHASRSRRHAGKLAERIVQLGGEPDLNPATLTHARTRNTREGKDLRDMV